MRRLLRWCAVTTLTTGLAVAGAASAYAQPSPPMNVPPPGKAATDVVPILRDVGVDQKLDQQVPLDLKFTDSTGKDVTLREYFSGKRPVVLALVYYQCPMLCMQVLSGLVGSLEGLPMDAGRE